MILNPQKLVPRGEVAKMFMDNASKTRRFIANDVMYVPGTEANILSVSPMTKRGLAVTFLELEAIIWRNEEVVAVAYL